MISQIRIKDFAIIDHVNLTFKEGLNIITGETGAGKSIIIEAISLALGSRADTAFVRTGKEKAVIQLVAETKGEEFIITREISANGKSSCRINDEIVTLSTLSKLCKSIADIHGQYDHQSLLNPDNHIHFVDLYDEPVISKAKEQVAELHGLYSDTKTQLNSLLSGQAEAERKRDFMRFELQEITAANPYVGEDDELSQNLVLLQNSEKIYNNLSASYEVLYDGSPSIIESLGRSLQLLQEVSEYAVALKELEESLSDAYFKLEDTSTEIRKFKEGISFSPELLEETISRLNTLDGLKRKYGGSLEKVLAYKEKLEENLDKIENIEELKQELSDKLKLYEKQLAESSLKLSDLRKKSARIIEKKVNKELEELNFKNALLSIDFGDRKGDKLPAFTANGIDQVEFLMTTNKGEAAKPLVKIASGGEISRIMLAFKQVIGDFDHVPTMIFDEIDNGISGITASIVGKKLLDISKSHQIICITHLPQIAAFGDYHYKIEKETKKDVTCTTVVPLSEEEKTYEIARLLGGINITETTLKSARELLDLSKM